MLMSPLPDIVQIYLMPLTCQGTDSGPRATQVLKQSLMDCNYRLIKRGDWRLDNTFGLFASSFNLIHKSFCNVLCHETGRPAAQPSMGGCARSVAMFLLSVTCHSKIQVRFHNRVFSMVRLKEKQEKVYGFMDGVAALHHFI